MHRLLEKVNLPGGKWLEPGCGDGSIIKAVRECRTDVQFVGVDIRNTKLIKNGAPELGTFFQGNILKPQTLPPEVLNGVFDVSIGNPPFSKAQEFINFSLERALQTLMLLRLNYVGSEGRSVFMQTKTPNLFVLPNRPPFKGDGKTDSIEYAWFHWEEQNLRSTGTFQVLNTTSLEVRRLG